MPAHHPPVPGDQRVRRDHERRPSPPGEDPAQHGQPRSVLRLESRPRLLTTKDVEFVAQHKDLDLVRLALPEAEHHQLDDAAEREVDERPQHEDLQDVTIEREAATLSTPTSPADRPVSGPIHLWHPTRHLVDLRRRAGRRRTEPSPPDLVAEHTVIGDAEHDVMLAISTRSALARVAALPPAQAEVILLRIVADLPLDDVASIVGRRKGAVRALQHRALRRLAREMPDGAAEGFVGRQARLNPLPPQ